MLEFRGSRELGISNLLCTVLLQVPSSYSGLGPAVRALRPAANHDITTTLACGAKPFHEHRRSLSSATK